MADYDVNKSRLSAIQSFRDKQITLVNKVKGGWYRTRFSLDDDIAIFEMYCERLKLGAIVPVAITQSSFDGIYEVAKCYVYLDHLIERLKNNEDPALILLEVISFND